MTPQQEQQFINNFLIGYTQDLDHTILDILFKLVISQEKDQDDIIIRCFERYLKASEPFLDHLSKEKIGFGLSCKTILQKFVYAQLLDPEIKSKFAADYNLVIEENTTSEVVQ